MARNPTHMCLTSIMTVHFCIVFDLFGTNFVARCNSALIDCVKLLNSSVTRKLKEDLCYIDYFQIHCNGNTDVFIVCAYSLVGRNFRRQTSVEFLRLSTKSAATT